ncbi:MAG: prepilin peptidase [Caldithrix sp.]|nr:prepilin peptidase [Caldithrix sp.]
MLYIVIVFGLIIGSFLNVCIYRIPQKRSLLGLRSKCPQCDNNIAWYDNIPVFSFIFLRGKCRKCQSKISFRYPLVEILSAVISGLLFWRYGWQPLFLINLVLAYAMLVITFIDWQFMLIPNSILLFTLFSGIAMNIIFETLSWVNSIVGLFLAGGLFYLINIVASKILKRDSMGMGDVKFAAVIGFFLGYKLMLIALYFGFVIALLYIIGSKLLRIDIKNRMIPMAPFFSMGVLIILIWGQQIIRAYVRLILY